MVGQHAPAEKLKAIFGQEDVTFVDFRDMVRYSARSRLRPRRAREGGRHRAAFRKDGTLTAANSS